MSKETYKSINDGWPADLPPCTREEAERAVRYLYRHFKLAVPVFKVRKCWVPTNPPFNQLRRGWRRLAHDVSHRIFRRMNLKSGKLEVAMRRPHHWGHVWYEKEVMRLILDRGFLTGRLKTKERTRPKADPLAKIEAATKRWQSKAKRAATALKKLERQRRYYEHKAETAAATTAIAA